MKKIYTTALAALLLPAFLIAQSLPDWTKTDSEGNEWNFHSLLQQGNAIVFEFTLTRNCPACGTASSEMEAVFQEYGGGTNNVLFFGLETVDSRTDEDLNNFRYDNGITYPFFKECSEDLQFYNDSFDPGPTLVPFQVVIIPDTANPANSEVVYTHKGWSTVVPPQIRFSLGQAGFDPVGLRAVKKSQVEFVLYPNPAEEHCLLQVIDLSIATHQLTVFNSLGEEITLPVTALSNNKLLLETAQLKNGLYYARISLGAHQMTLPLIISH